MKNKGDLLTLWAKVRVRDILVSRGCNAAKNTSAGWHSTALRKIHALDCVVWAVIKIPQQGFREFYLTETFTHFRNKKNKLSDVTRDESSKLKRKRNRDEIETKLREVEREKQKKSSEIKWKLKSFENQDEIKLKIKKSSEIETYDFKKKKSKKLKKAWKFESKLSKN